MMLRLVWDGPFTLVNARGPAWYSDTAEDAALRAWAGAETRRAGVRFDGPVTVEALMTAPKTGTLADPAAICLVVKHIVDGMVDGGAIPDDSGEWVKSETYYPPERTGTRSVIVVMKTY